MYISIFSYASVKCTAFAWLGKFHLRVKKALYCSRRRLFGGEITSSVATAVSAVSKNVEHHARKHLYPTRVSFLPFDVAVSSRGRGIRKIKGQFGPHCEGIKITPESAESPLLVSLLPSSLPLADAQPAVARESCASLTCELT